MVHEILLGDRKKMSFSRIDEVLEMPNLIEIQKESYRKFVEEGLKEVFDGYFPYHRVMAITWCWSLWIIRWKTTRNIL